MCRKSLPSVFWDLFLFSFTSSSFHPTSTLKALIWRAPCGITDVLLLFRLFWMLLTGSCSVVLCQHPCSLSPFLSPVMARGCLPFAPLRTRLPAHLLRSNSAFPAPSEDLSPSLTQCCIIKHGVDTKRTWWKLYSKSVFSLTVCDLLFPCSPVRARTCGCARESVRVGNLIIPTRVLAHSRLFVRPAGFVTAM